MLTIISDIDSRKLSWKTKDKENELLHKIYTDNDLTEGSRITT